MKLILTNFSVVLVTQDHLASISHELLVNKQVIPNHFQKKDNSFNTPVVSQIHYSNGFSIIGEPNKTLLQFLNPSTNESNNSNNLTLMKEVSSKYIRLFDIRYQAIGINFDFVRDDLEYQSCIEQLVRTDSNHLSFESNKGETQSIDLSYRLKGKQFNVTIMKAERKATSGSVPKTKVAFVPFFKLNFHYPSDYTDNTVSIIEELEKNYKESKKFIEGF